MSILSKIGKAFGIPEVHITSQNVKAQVIAAIKPDFDHWVQSEALALESGYLFETAKAIAGELRLTVPHEDIEAILKSFVAKYEPIVQDKLDALLDAEAGKP